MMDPYEQQLLRVFDRHDHERRGSLDRAGLVQLCRALQLEERGVALIESLLRSNSRISFPEFKEALVTLLDTTQNNREFHNNDTKAPSPSPEREVSPKFVFGSKKYGRRSRPKANDLSDPQIVQKTNVPLQKSCSQSDVVLVKKRKLKRCTSFPGGGGGGNEYEYEYEQLYEGGNDDVLVATEEMLREAWRTLGVGEDGFLNQSELILVCDAIGLHKLAGGVLRQLADGAGGRISFRELLQALRQDDAWADQLSFENNQQEEEHDKDTKEKEKHLNLSCLAEEVFKYITLGPDGSGFVCSEALADMWESAGITSPKALLSDLGFERATSVDVHELAAVLEREINANPHIALLQASLTLYQAEIKCLKTIVEQTSAEREKLKSDVSAANERSALLAQEVDDNHARMEQAAENQVRLLEQRHACIVKELAERSNGEKEQLATLNERLERKIATLESEEAKLRVDVEAVRKYAGGVEAENRALRSEVGESIRREAALALEVGLLEAERNARAEREAERVEPLLAQVAELRAENARLRDGNDEMLAEIERLGGRMAALRARSNEQDHVDCSSGLGSKRRNDESPSKELNDCRLGDTSPRLGKVRKYQRQRDDPIENELSDRSLEPEDETKTLKARIEQLERILDQKYIPYPRKQNLNDSNPDPEDNLSAMQLRIYCTDLEQLLFEIRRSVPNETKTNEMDELLTNLEAKLTEFRLKTDHSNTNDEPKTRDVATSTENEREVDESEMSDLKAKCDELENCVDLLKNEYERCEDYWASKLDEERQMFEQEQNQSSEKLTELFAKIAEYEAQFAEQGGGESGRLPVIEETYQLEKQFTDLEQEYEEFREVAQQEIIEKDREIEMLKDRASTANCHVAVQADLCRKKPSNLSNHVIEATNLFSADTLPFYCSPTEKRIELEPTTLVLNEQEDSSSFIWNKESSDTNSLIFKLAANEQEQLEEEQKHQQQQQQQHQQQQQKQEERNVSATPCRPKRTRKYHHGRSPLVCKKQEEKKRSLEENKWTTGSLDSNGTGTGTETEVEEEQKCLVSVNLLNNLTGRTRQLEQKCRYLHVVLKQHHYQAEQLLHRCWQQQRSEKAELQFHLKSSQERLEMQTRVCNEQLDRLARADTLVKELYVENSYLIANVHRVEQQLHMLVNCNNASSSV